ncbi:MAG TPA: threonine ammonia-lyase [Candidatus Sulfotelmatobacter sp.]|nr:threonine ammonia-lyase [Candidatus Sulfotelmatobacter sp.]
MPAGSFGPFTGTRFRAAARALVGVAHVTPLLASQTFSRMAGCRVALKCENLQRAGSFKVRGAAVRMRALAPRERARGVVAASAGNHAQGVALAAARAGIRATVVMPLHTPIAKVAATEGYGARVILHGESYDDALARACQVAAGAGAALIPAFDDPLVILGQGTVGLEILAQAPACDAIVAPVGGGGLIAGIALAVRRVRPRVRVYGVQAAGAAAFARSLARRRIMGSGTPRTIADGIAVRRPGEVTFPIVQREVEDVVTVDDEEIAATLVLLLERAKLLAEGAGAAALAALLYGRLPLAGKSVVAVVSGGNIDSNILSRLLDKGLAKAGRYLALEVPLADRPGALRDLLAVVAGERANVISVNHDRLDPRVAVDRVEVALTVEVRDRAHGHRLLRALAARGYRARRT